MLRHRRRPLELDRPVLPYIEKTDLFNQAGQTLVPMNSSASVTAVIGVFMPMLHCPSDEPTPPRTDSADLGGTLAGLTNYKGVSGSNWGKDYYPLPGSDFSTPYRFTGGNNS